MKTAAAVLSQHCVQIQHGRLPLCSLLQPLSHTQFKPRGVHS